MIEKFTNKSICMYTCISLDNYCFAYTKSTYYVFQNNVFVLNSSFKKKVIQAGPISGLMDNNHQGLTQNIHFFRNKSRQLYCFLLYPDNSTYYPFQRSWVWIHERIPWIKWVPDRISGKWVCLPPQWRWPALWLWPMKQYS